MPDERCSKKLDVKDRKISFVSSRFQNEKHLKDFSHHSTSVTEVLHAMAYAINLCSYSTIRELNSLHGGLSE